jgi:transketolase
MQQSGNEAVCLPLAPATDQAHVEEITFAPLARDARGWAIDAISAANSGHMGLPLGCAEIGANLWGKNLQYNPEEPQWLNRDRFILSAGHGSMFIYAWLHMAGYDLPLDEIKQFRQHHSMTPGHPEFPSSKHNTPGIEATTGPLGAGIGNAVGMAAAAKLAAGKYNTEDHKIFDHHVVVLCGDGCLQEGVGYEAISFAGHDGLDNLILIYDSNEVTLDKMANFTQSVDHAKLFDSLGWNVICIDGQTASITSQNGESGLFRIHCSTHRSMLGHRCLLRVAGSCCGSLRGLRAGVGHCGLRGLQSPVHSLEKLG